MRPVVKDVTDENYTVICSCGHEYINPLPAEDLQYFSDFGEYKNLYSEPCPACGLLHTFNMNICACEFDEDEIFTEEHMPESEKACREGIRQIMFKKRPDLKGKNRKKFNEERKKKLEKRWGLPVAEIRRNNKRVARIETGKRI